MGILDFLGNAASSVAQGGGGFLNDILRMYIPHSISSGDYAALQDKLFTPQPQDQINVTGPVTGPNDIAQRQASGAYDQGPQAPLVRGPSAGLQQSILRLLPPQIGAAYAMKIAQEAPEQNARSDIADAFSKYQSQPTLPGMTRMDALNRSGNGDIGAGAANIGANPAGSLPGAVRPPISPDIMRQMAIKAFLAGGNPADVTALMNIGKQPPIKLGKDETLLDPNDYRTLATGPQVPDFDAPQTFSQNGVDVLGSLDKHSGKVQPIAGYSPKQAAPDDLEKQGLALYGPNYKQNPEFQAALTRRFTGLLSPQQEAQQLRIAQGKHDITINSSQYNLTPDETDALNTGIKDGTIDPNKVTSRTAKIFATMKLADPSTDFVSAGGVANLKKNPAVQQKIMAAKTIPTILDNLEEAGKKLNLSDTKFIGGIQNWISGQTNDPNYTAYMTQRNDAILRIAYAMRGTGMSDEAAKLEQEVAKPTMSPSALHAYVQAQMRSLQPMLDQYAGIDARPGIPGARPTPGANRVIHFNDLPK